MGSLFKSKPAPVPVAPVGPSAEEIRADEQAKIKEENLTRIKDQEGKRSKRRAILSAEEDEAGDIQRKQLFGE